MKYRLLNYCWCCPYESTYASAEELLDDLSRLLPRMVLGSKLVITVDEKVELPAPLKVQYADMDSVTV